MADILIILGIMLPVYCLIIYIGIWVEMKFAGELLWYGGPDIMMKTPIWMIYAGLVTLLGFAGLEKFLPAKNIWYISNPDIIDYIPTVHMFVGGAIFYGFAAIRIIHLHCAHTKEQDARWAREDEIKKQNSGGSNEEN